MAAIAGVGAVAIAVAAAYRGPVPRTSCGAFRCRKRCAPVCFDLAEQVLLGMRAFHHVGPLRGIRRRSP